MAKKTELPEVFPEVCVDHDREKYHIEVDLPGAKKESIELEMGEMSFCIRAPREDLVYSACYTLAHGIDTKKVNAKFDNGQLTITAPFKNPIGGTKIRVG